MDHLPPEASGNGCAATLRGSDDRLAGRMFLFSEFSGSSEKGQKGCSCIVRKDSMPAVQDSITRVSRWNQGAPILHGSSNNAANRSCMSREVVEATAIEGQSFRPHKRRHAQAYRIGIM